MPGARAPELQQKGANNMISANITNAQRKAIYRREGWRCALCDSTKYLQIHHIIKRSQGGSNHPHNLITLCADCHALAHGTNLRGWQDVTQESIVQACTEYLADYYAPQWNPWASRPYPCPDCPRRAWCQGEDCPLDDMEPP